MANQKTDWGEILWLKDDNEFLTIQGLQVGIVTIFPGAHQQKHIHYEEQVIYVIQGQALSMIDGVESSLSSGDFFHWQAGVEHEIFNIGNVPFQHLLISNPVSLEPVPSFPMEEKKEEENEISSDLIYIATEAIRTQFLETLHCGYGIFDSMGNMILQSQYFPDYCVECCQPEKNPGACSCMRQLPDGDRAKENVFRCEHGMEVFHYPVHFRGVFLGYIQSGYIRYSNPEKGKIENVYDVPESVVAGIKALLRRIVKAMKNYCEFEQFRRVLIEKTVCIASHEEAQRLLMKNLREADYAMTDLKINNHFLFNTLNSMASMALDGGLMPLYQSIVDLSKMFHYTLRTQNSMVPLEKEVDYVRAYLKLQKLRYGEELKASASIDQDVLSFMVPFNFLQPIVENAFVHGFSEAPVKKLKVVMKKQKTKIQIKVINSGTSLTPQMCRTINQGILSNTAHGLSMIYHKLTVAYEKPCKFCVSTQKNGDTCFLVELPIEEKGGMA